MLNDILTKTIAAEERQNNGNVGQSSTTSANDAIIDKAVASDGNLEENLLSNSSSLKEKNNPSATTEEIIPNAGIILYFKGKIAQLLSSITTYFIILIIIQTDTPRVAARSLFRDHSLAISDTSPFLGALVEDVSMVHSTPIPACRASVGESTFRNEWTKMNAELHVKMDKLDKEVVKLNKKSDSTNEKLETIIRLLLGDGISNSNTKELSSLSSNNQRISGSSIYYTFI